MPRKIHYAAQPMTSERKGGLAVDGWWRLSISRHDRFSPFFLSHVYTAESKPGWDKQGWMDVEGKYRSIQRRKRDQEGESRSGSGDVMRR